MLIKKSRGHAHINLAIRLFLLLPLLPLLTSCTTFIPGLDRILFSNSSAKVGPLVTADEQYPVTTDEEVSTTLENESAVESVAGPSELINKIKSNQKSGTDPEPTIQNKDPVAASTSNPIARQSSTSKTKPANTPELDSPDVEQIEVTVEKAIVEIAVEYGAVSGKVVLIGEQEQQLPTTGTMITLTPKTMMNEEQDRLPQAHIIDMEDKTYLPRYSTIHAGDQVVFVNKDNIRHNVFSSSGNNAFDLGTYGAGLKRAVTLKESGIVKIYCNIHSEMATFIAVGNQGLSVRTDDQGRYRINQVLPGTYEIAIWNIRGETKRIVEVKADETIELVDRIDTTVAKIEPHKNKFGGDYSKNSTLFEDEFY